MAKLKVLVRETLRTVDCCGTGTITVNEVAALDHEVLDDTVKLASFIALRSSKMILRFAGAVLPKILCSSWYDVGEQFHFDTPERFAAECNVKEDNWIWLSGHLDISSGSLCWSS